MNGVQLYIIAYFSGDIVRPKIGSIISYVRGSTKLTSLRAHSSYEDFVTLLEETSEIRREDCKLYNFFHGCACVILSVQDFVAMINMHKTNPGTPFHIWIFNLLRVPSQNSQNFIFDFYSSGKEFSTTKDTGSGKGLSLTKVGWGPLRHNSFPDPNLEHRGYPETNGRGLDLRRFGHLVDDNDVPQSNNSFETICTDVPPSNEPSIPQSNVHHLNEPVLTNLLQTNEPFQTITTDMRGSFEQAYQLLMSYFAEVRLVDPDFVFDIQTTSSKNKRFTRYGVAYTNYVESWNNVILKVRDLPIHLFIEELHRICLKMSYTFREKVEKSQTRLTPWARDHYGTCSCRWWQTMGIPCEHRVRALSLSNVDPATRVSEYFTNDT
ncbi:hypothetical protein GIB67_020344 [Kingdonia uniflora]|uniref:SWIM-type domain-containing protein n=1 Tax=Kingdonia uniflora TaxID=39325 RepID=A0A7J7LR82_9MAGN|nr:hypothetical protein GIB67_020344 [Kingdonia uniflora]